MTRRRKPAALDLFLKRLNVSMINGWNFLRPSTWLGGSAEIVSDATKTESARCLGRGLFAGALPPKNFRNLKSDAVGRYIRSFGRKYNCRHSYAGIIERSTPERGNPTPFRTDPRGEMDADVPPPTHPPTHARIFNYLSLQFLTSPNRAFREFEL